MIRDGPRVRKVVDVTKFLQLVNAKLKGEGRELTSGDEMRSLPCRLSKKVQG